MTQPAQYVPKTLVEVSMMVYESWTENAQNVKDWIVSVLEAAFPSETVYINDNGYGQLLIMVSDNVLFFVENGQCVYLDEDGFHTSSTGAFNLLYKEKPPA